MAAAPAEVQTIRVETVPEASNAAARLLEIATRNADELVEDARQQAAGVALPQRVRQQGDPADGGEDALDLLGIAGENVSWFQDRWTGMIAISPPLSESTSAARTVLATGRTARTPRESSPTAPTSSISVGCAIRWRSRSVPRWRRTNCSRWRTRLTPPTNPGA